MTNVMPGTLADQIIAQKIKEWELQKQKVKADSSLRELKIHPFLCISRDFGCREEEIVPYLEKSLGWKVYGRNLLDHLARRESLSHSFMETLDEQRQNLVDNWINYLIRSGSILQDDYVIQISKLIKVIVTQESAILLGRGANYLLSDKKEGLRVRLTAPFQQRVKNIAQVRNIEESQAKELVKKTDTERRDFTQRYFKKDFDSCEGYDLTFNTASLSNEQMFRTVSMLINEKRST